MSGDCPWIDLFDEKDQKNLQDGYLVAGISSVLLNACLCLVIFKSDLWLNRSYKLLSYFILAACIRHAVPLVAGLVPQEYLNNVFDCNLRAFGETFMAALVWELLTHVCIERFVVAKFIARGAAVELHHYQLFVLLSFMFACFYSICPLFGLGGYGYDFTCQSCTYDMVLPETLWMKYLVVFFLFLRSLKCVFVMLYMLIKATTKESTKYNKESEMHLKEMSYTKTVIAVTITNWLYYLPITATRAYVILPQLRSDVLPELSAFFVKWSLVTHWFAPAATAVVLFMVDAPLRSKMMFKSSEEVKEDKEQKTKEKET